MGWSSERSDAALDIGQRHHLSCNGGERSRALSGSVARCAKIIRGLPGSGLYGYLDFAAWNRLTSLGWTSICSLLLSRTAKGSVVSSRRGLIRAEATNYRLWNFHLSSISSTRRSMRLKSTGSQTMERLRSRLPIPGVWKGKVPLGARERKRTSQLRLARVSTRLPKGERSPDGRLKTRYSPSSPRTRAYSVTGAWAFLTRASRCVSILASSARLVSSDAARRPYPWLRLFIARSNRAIWSSRESLAS